MISPSLAPEARQAATSARTAREVDLRRFGPRHRVDEDHVDGDLVAGEELRRVREQVGLVDCGWRR